MHSRANSDDGGSAHARADADDPTVGDAAQMSLLSVVLVAATPHNSDPLPWQTSLSTCWTNASCNRALIVGHGGDPNFVTLLHVSASSSPSVP